jgi:hypothetical protein
VREHDRDAGRRGGLVVLRGAAVQDQVGLPAEARMVGDAEDGAFLVLAEEVGPGEDTLW